MKLKNINPVDLIGRTIIYRHQFWRVDEVNGDNLKLGKSWNFDKGMLRRDQLADCRLYPSREDILKMYPRLLRALRWSCMLTQGEAEGAILGFITTGAYYLGSEALAHIGGSGAAISHALRCRYAVQRQARFAK